MGVYRRISPQFPRPFMGGLYIHTRKSYITKKKKTGKEEKHTKLIHFIHIVIHIVNKYTEPQDSRRR